MFNEEYFKAQRQDRERWIAGQIRVHLLLKRPKPRRDERPRPRD